MSEYSKKQNYTFLLSIIVPTYNRPESLKRCLASLAGLDGDNETFEIIVVDDGSSFPCERIVSQIFPEGSCLLLRQENKGPGAARNHGAGKASGHFLAFLDDDCALPPGWFETVKKHLDEDRMIGGTTINNAPGVFPEASQLLIDYLYLGFKKQGRQVSFLTSNNMVVPAQIFQQSGGFSEDFPRAAGEDRDFCERWLNNGHEILHIPEIEVEHYHTLNAWKFSRQHYNYGMGAYIYHRRRKARNGTCLRLEPLRFYLDLLLFPFRRGKNYRAGRARLSLCLLLSQFCNCAGYLSAAFSRIIRRGRHSQASSE